MAHELHIREAHVADAPEIARVHVLAWREAYAHLLPAAFLAALEVDAYAHRWERLIESELSVFVATLDDRVVGWASASEGRDEDAPRGRELEGIYTAAAAYGSGAGQRLLDAAIGDDPAYLWMADDNPRAEAFYRKNRFERDGANKLAPIGPHGLTVVRMVR